MINESDIHCFFKSVSTTVITNIANIQKSLGKGSDCITDSFMNHTISISNYNPLAWSSYIKLPKELDHPGKGLINVQHFDDNSSFKRVWPDTQFMQTIIQKELQKMSNIFHKDLILKPQSFQSTLETFTKFKERIPWALARLVMKIRKNIQFMYEKNVGNIKLLIYYC